MVIILDLLISETVIHSHFHVSGPSEEVGIVKETDGGKEALVTNQFPADLGSPGGVAVVDVVYGALVVHPATR